jgi:citrate lyase subunit gamma (acyl carrier protein)
MKSLVAAQAGTFESSDIIVLIEPQAPNTERIIEVESTVMLQYGESIKSIIVEMLDQYQLLDVHIIAKDKGALEPVIRARVETAINRSLGNQ